MKKEVLMAQLLSYLTVSDTQIHSNEMAILKDYWQKNEFSEEEEELCHNILGDKEEKNPLDELIADVGELNLSETEKRQFIKNLCDLAICDMHKHDLEEEIIKKIAEQLHFQGVKTILKAAYDKRKRKLKRKINRFILEDPQYGQAIRSGAEIAKNDMKFITTIIDKTSKATKECLEMARKLRKSTVKNTYFQEARDLEKEISDFIIDLENRVIHSVKMNREILNRKRRAMNYFTISFLGKTKAGKSTLHAIITDKAFIGTGRQRTTRFNRVYEWDNIRIIDTPGFGAAEAGGRKDEEIAKSVIDETDVLCHVVTSNNISTNEFNFIEDIKEKNKPLVFILNVMDDFESHPVTKKRFIQDPHYWKVRKDRENIQGHINRLKECIGGLKNLNFTIDFEKEIIPVHLLAALKSKEEEYRVHKDNLYKGSHLDDFVNYVRESIIESITLRRSQTIIDGIADHINTNLGYFEMYHDLFADFARKVKEPKEENLLKKIEDDKEKVIKNCLQGIEPLFETFLVEINKFVELHYYKKKEQLEKEWAKSKTKVENRVNEVIRKNIDLELKDIQDGISDLTEDLDSFIRYQSIELKAHNLINTQKILSIIGAALSASSSIVLFVSSVAVASTGFFLVGLLVAFLSGAFFKSKKEKKQKAINDLTESLKESMETYKAKIVEQIPKRIEEILYKMALEAGGILSQVQSGAEIIESCSLFLLNKYQQYYEETNKYFARRIFDFCSGSVQPKLEPGDYSDIKVKRNDGWEITIPTNIDCSEEKIKKAIKILQKDISILKPDKEEN